MRESQEYAKDKLKILESYISLFTVSMRPKKWRALHYIDLQAGPGKNIFDPNREVMLGSPLIALTTRVPFDRYYFVELGNQEHQALQTRISQSDRRDRVKIYNEDCNIAVNTIVQDIQKIDKPYSKDIWVSLNLAFLDPEGLELHWKTVEKLGQVKRMDLIINFSTSGFTRNASQLVDKEKTRLDSFFGTGEWKEVYRKIADKDITYIRRAMLDFYIGRLKSLGYVYNLERDIVPDEKVFRNSKGVQIYTLMFASKHPQGIDFWNIAIQHLRQPPLF